MPNCCQLGGGLTSMLTISALLLRESPLLSPKAVLSDLDDMFFTVVGFCHGFL